MIALKWCCCCWWWCLVIYRCHTHSVLNFGFFNSGTVFTHLHSFVPSIQFSKCLAIATNYFELYVMQCTVQKIVCVDIEENIALVHTISHRFRSGKLTNDQIICRQTSIHFTVVSVCVDDHHSENAIACGKPFLFCVGLFFSLYFLVCDASTVFHYFPGLHATP